MKNMLYKAKGALALTLAVSICGAQCVPVFAAEALSAAQQGVQVTPVKELTEEEKAALQLPKLTAEEALAKAKKHSPDLREIRIPWIIWMIRWMTSTEAQAAQLLCQMWNIKNG